MSSVSNPNPNPAEDQNRNENDSEPSFSFADVERHAENLILQHMGTPPPDPTTLTKFHARVDKRGNLFEWDLPFRFKLIPEETSMPRSVLYHFITISGGLVTLKETDKYAVNILNDLHFVLREGEDMTLPPDTYSSTLIYEAIKRKLFHLPFPDPKEHLVGPSQYEPYDLVKILKRDVKWADLKKKTGPIEQVTAQQVAHVDFKVISATTRQQFVQLKPELQDPTPTSAASSSASRPRPTPVTCATASASSATSTTVSTVTKNAVVASSAKPGSSKEMIRKGASTKQPVQTAPATAPAVSKPTVIVKTEKQSPEKIKAPKENSQRKVISRLEDPSKTTSAPASTSTNNKTNIEQQNPALPPSRNRTAGDQAEIEIARSLAKDGNASSSTATAGAGTTNVLVDSSKNLPKVREPAPSSSTKEKDNANTNTIPKGKGAPLPSTPNSLSTTNVRVAKPTIFITSTFIKPKSLVTVGVARPHLPGLPPMKKIDSVRVQSCTTRPTSTDPVLAGKKKAQPPDTNGWFIEDISDDAEEDAEGESALVPVEVEGASGVSIPYKKGQPFTDREDYLIVQKICEKEAFLFTGGKILFMQMAKSKDFAGKRTYWSLMERWRRTIKPRLLDHRLRAVYVEKWKITPEHLKKMLAGFQQSKLNLHFNKTPNINFD